MASTTPSHSPSRLIRQRLMPHVIEATILTSCGKEENVFIPPIVHSNRSSLQIQTTPVFFPSAFLFCHTSTIRKDRFWQWSDCSWTSLASPTTSSTSADPEPAIPTCSFCTRPTTELPTYIRLRLPPFRQPATLCTANFSVMTARLGD